ncbi:MAG: hypothetical protein NTV19_20245 [Burkholderiales bacterium]|nr:hypothetical protein [Burkholderiales bacterium]
MRGLVPGLLFVGVLWRVSTVVPQMSVLWFGIAVLSMAIPAMLALWHQATVRRLILLHQYQSGSLLHRWGNYRFLTILWLGSIAIFLCAAILLQSVHFTRVEWLLLIAAPAIFFVMQRAIESRAVKQFSAALYGKCWSFWVSTLLTTFALAFVWFILKNLEAQAQVRPYFERVHELQSKWSMVPTATVKWALDASAWGQVAIESLSYMVSDFWWRNLIVIVTLPFCIFYFISLSLSGLTLPVLEVNRVFIEPLTAESSPQRVGAARAALWAAISTMIIIALFEFFGNLDHRLRASDSPFAIKELPQCEQIDGKSYALNTSAALKALIDEGQGKMSGYQTNACVKLAAIEAQAAKGVDAYLDWYFSLGADWLRFAALLSGDVNLLLEAKFSQLVVARPEIVQLLPSVQNSYESQWSELISFKNQLFLDDRGCKVIGETSCKHRLLELEGSKARLVSGSGAGLISGALAVKVTAKAMSKASMKTASSVLAKVAAKKIVGKGAAAVAGAAAGMAVGSAVPVLGTAVGAIVGAGVGLLTSVTVDMAMLMLEEKVTRDDMRKDLINSVVESLQPYRETFNCNAIGNTPEKAVKQ